MYVVLISCFVVTARRPEFTSNFTNRLRKTSCEFGVFPLCTPEKRDGLWNVFCARKTTVNTLFSATLPYLNICVEVSSVVLCCVALCFRSVVLCLLCCVTLRCVALCCGPLCCVVLLKSSGFLVLRRLRVVSNFGDGDCGADEIHTRARAKF